MIDYRSSTSTTRAAGRLLLASLALAAAWLGLNLSLLWLEATTILATVIRLAVVVAIAIGLWLGLARTPLSSSKRIATWFTLTASLVAWLAITWWLAMAGVFMPRPGAIPILPFAILLPPLLAVPILLRSSTIGALLDAMPKSWLIGLQVYRMVGGIFLVAWLHSELSAIFAIPAGIGDIVTGAAALSVASLVAANTSTARPAAIGWNLVGLADLAIAITLGFLLSPGPLQLIVPEVSNLALGAYPEVMIPAFIVPLSIILHALSLHQLSGTKSVAKEL